MKKIISLLLAVLMMFSLVSVAFAETAPPADGTEEVLPPADAEVTDPAAPEEDDATDSIIPDLGEYDWILDLPFWTVGPAFKLAKIALKLVTVYLKVAKIFGLVEKDMDDYIIEAILGLLENAENGETEEEVTDPTDEPVAPEEIPDAA